MSSRRTQPSDVLRLRLLRVLLPLLLVLLAALVWWSWEPRSGVHREGATTAATGSGPRAEGVSFKQFGPGAGSDVEGRAEVFEPRDDGSLYLEGIHDLEFQREERGPLLVSAGRGERTGEEGSWRWRFDGDVVFREPDTGLEVVLPALEIDDAKGQAQSRGTIRFLGPELEGRAESFAYSLEGEPGELVAPDFTDRRGGRLTAERAVLLDGLRDVELIGEVRVLHETEWIDAGRLHVLRGSEGRPRQAVAKQDVTGGWATGSPEAGHLRGQRLEIRWDAEGDPESLTLAGDSMVARGSETISAAVIEAARASGTDPGWNLQASDDVFVQGRFDEAPGLLRADRLRATLDDQWVLREAEAVGRVRFEGRDTRAEAERGTFVAAPGRAGEVELFGDELRKARLAQGRTRVAAREIRTDVRGAELVAEGHVEATLLPQSGAAREPSRTRLFAEGRAIHFVSERLDSSRAGEHLVFSGSVRGWQGERNLAAATVVVDQEGATLQAREAVSTRIPREREGPAAAEGDYLQITADRLDYDDRDGRAVYEGSVRVRLAEGWLEAQRVEVELGQDTRRIRELRARQDVRIEFHRTGEGDLARPITGTADRLVYRPAEASVRLYGEQSPAAVRRIGEGGGTTTGRELHYRVDTGTLDVESGEQGPGRIRS